MPSSEAMLSLKKANFRVLVTELFLGPGSDCVELSFPRDFSENDAVEFSVACNTNVTLYFVNGIVQAKLELKLKFLNDPFWELEFGLEFRT